MIQTLDNWTSLRDEGKDVDVIYFDFRKAFDKDRWQRFVESDGFYYKEQNCVRAELQHPELDCPFRQLISHQPDSSEENNSSSTIFQGDF
ncbi:hypothetical protein Y032_0490g2384 [Ancylostoma ceylanicum]|uniref:Uncharacterized protein n=1 Tax=Ancylostoma ceylanicum TaxID=53326 RepID=A0A016WV77_9BILA|nr:hypothetical protein Y032_0490g2384 [Ancylostoma ceylanicum]